MNALDHAYSHGYASYREGRTIDENQFFDRKRAEQWERGWMDAYIDKNYSGIAHGC